MLQTYVNPKYFQRINKAKSQEKRNEIVQKNNRLAFVWDKKFSWNIWVLLERR